MQSEEPEPGASRTSEAVSAQSLDAKVRDFDRALLAFETATPPPGGYQASDVEDLTRMGAIAHAIYGDLAKLAATDGVTLPADDSKWPEPTVGDSVGPLAKHIAELARAQHIATEVRYFFFGNAAHLFKDPFTAEHTVRVREIEFNLITIVEGLVCPSCVTHSL